MDEGELRRRNRKVADLTNEFEISGKLMESKRALLIVAVMRRNDEEIEKARQEVMAAAEATLDREIALRRYIADVSYQDYR